jgi:hypothetical protein
VPAFLARAALLLAAFVPAARPLIASRGRRGRRDVLLGARLL